ncbi:hypothetical protein B0H16DRAFT_1574926 [Mycena metata]|uniref:F-box domain-containing protein n=1 Tax=Mycena metata TaxID=1033252 RepID=A0AAD7MWP9_9AGAR|nr:hypothetical protein B0H16DRAFT_1574926 [Mycena metata]
MSTAGEIRTRLQRIDAEIAQLELSLQSLQETRTGLLEELRHINGIHPENEIPSAGPLSREAVAYPVLTLPFEITSKIFLDCLPEECDDPVRPYPSQDEAPLVLTRVCRDWRTIALSTSMLWSHVRIELDSDEGRGSLDSKWVALLDIWLQRSQQQPLSLVVSNHSYADPDETLLRVLDSHSRRWRNVALKLPFNYFPRLAARSLPLLERLTLSAHGSPDIINPISAFRHAPILRHVCFEGGMHPADVNLPWEQLTSVELYGASADDCLELLRLAPNVTRCVLDVQYDSHGLAIGSPLPSLSSFTFTGPASWGILRFLAMPALQRLDLSRCSPSRNFAPIIQFLKRSECDLRELKIYVRSTSAVQTIFLLHLLPSLTSVDLILADADTGTAIFLEFKFNEENRIILPHVESMSVHCINDDNQRQMFEVITDALQIRADPSDSSVALKSFTLSMEGLGRTPSPEVRQQWNELAG